MQIKNEKNGQSKVLAAARLKLIEERIFTSGALRGFTPCLCGCQRFALTAADGPH